MNKKTIGISILTLGTVLALGACGNHTEESGKIIKESGSETVYTDGSGDTLVETDTALKDDGYFKVLVRDGENPKIKDIVSYDTDFKNADWDNMTLDIDHIKLVNVSDFKDNNDTTYKELMSLKYKLTNEDSSDKHITPDKAELVMKDGKTVDAEAFLDYWDDEVLTKDAHKDGYIHFKVKEENKLEDIEKVNVTFKAKDDQDNETTHTYTIDLPVAAAN